MLDRIPLPSQFDRVIVLGGVFAGALATPLLLVLLALLFVDRISGPELVFWLVFALILVACKAWSSRFRYGPLEWLWRAFTYLHIPAMRDKRLAPA